MQFNEILFSFIETIGFVENEIDFQISENNSERFEICNELYTKFIAQYTEIESQQDFMFDFVTKALTQLKNDF